MLFNIYAITDLLKTYPSNSNEFLHLSEWLKFAKKNIKEADSEELKQFDIAIELCLKRAKEVSNE